MRHIQPDFRQELHRNGFRATPERLRLVSILWAAKRPLTVDEIARKVNCDVSTIYRILNGLLGKGLIVRGIGAAGVEGDMRGDIRAAHFSYTRKDHHHHLVCADCGFTKQCVVCE